MNGTICFHFHAVYFSNQYLSIGTKLPQNYNLYGLGEHKTNLRLGYVHNDACSDLPASCCPPFLFVPHTHNRPGTYTLWTYDGGTPSNMNLCRCTWKQCFGINVYCTCRWRSSVLPWPSTWGCGSWGVPQEQQWNGRGTGWSVPHLSS